MGKKLLVTGVTVGSILTIVSVAVFTFESSLVKSLVTKSVQLIPTTELYENWLNVPVPIYMKVFLYNLKNPDEFEKGGRPVFEEIGPFVYKETRCKDNIVDNMNYTITYSDRRYYNFLPEMSKYTESYPITTINLAAVTILNFIQHSTGIAHTAVNLAFQLTGETVVIKKTAGEILWGYNDAFLAAVRTFVPNLVPTSTVGLFAGQNDSSYGHFTIYTGADDITKLGVIERFNGKSEVDNWSNKYANMINGTDGSLSKPFVNKGERQYAFQSTLCRSLYGYYTKTDTLGGIDLWVIEANSTLFANATENPENSGFCLPADNCLSAGVFNLSSCLKMGPIGVPLLMSNPHFLYADPKYPGAFDGISAANDDDHNTKVWMDPVTGIELKANQRLQFNANLINDSRINAAKNLRPMFYPLMWVDENFEADDKMLKKFYWESKFPIILLNYMKFVFLAVGLAMFLVCLVFLVRRNKLEDDERDLNIQDETETESNSGTTPILLN